MNKYVCFYKFGRYEVESDTLYHAQLKCAKQIGLKKYYKIAVVLAEKADAPGIPVVHLPLF